MAALNRYQGTVRFFARHSWLLQPRATPMRTVSIARRELKQARIWVRVLRRELAETVAALRPRPRSVSQIICVVFGAACGKALAVASCESHLSVSARNGQYLGIFQMGWRERARFGGSSLNPWDQVRAAYRYWLVAGWSPWSCA